MLRSSVLLPLPPRVPARDQAVNVLGLPCALAQQESPAEAVFLLAVELDPVGGSQHFSQPTAEVNLRFVTGCVISAAAKGEICLSHCLDRLPCVRRHVVWEVDSLGERGHLKSSRLRNSSMPYLLHYCNTATQRGSLRVVEENTETRDAETKICPWCHGEGEIFAPEFAGLDECTTC